MSANSVLALIILWYAAVWGTAVYLVAILDRSLWWLVLALLLSSVTFKVKSK